MDERRRDGLAEDWLIRESIVDHPGPYRLRLIAAGTADDIIDSLERVLSELRCFAPDISQLNAGSAVIDWDIQPQEPAP